MRNKVIGHHAQAGNEGFTIKVTLRKLDLEELAINFREFVTVGAAIDICRIKFRVNIIWG